MSIDTTTADYEVTPQTTGADAQAKKANRPRTKASADKWGDEVISFGFCILPSLLFRAQRRLGLSPTHLAILVQLADFWWDAKRKPFPKKVDLAERLNLSERQVQRLIAELEKMGYVRRIERSVARRGKISNEYDLSGLVARLKVLEPEFREVAEENRARRKAVAKPNYRPPRKAVSADDFDELDDE